MQPYLTFVHALSPLHAGTGQGVGVIDLPIAREKATDLPLLPGSSVKGTLRDAYDEAKANTLFGMPESASQVQFSDQRLLLLPIRSLAGTFAWVTSPYLLARFARDVQDCKPDFKLALPAPRAPSEPGGASCALTTGARTLICAIGQTQRVVLEDLDLVPDAQQDAKPWADFIGRCVFAGASDWQEMLRQRLCIVHDHVLSFLLATATEVTARIKLKDETKTVDTDTGALWYEEALPAETILAGLMIVAPPGNNRRSAQEAQALNTAALKDVAAVTDAKTLQFGGKATVGRGLCRVQVVQEVPAS